MATQFYREKDPRTGKEVFKEVGTRRYIGPTEFGSGKNFTEAPTTRVSPLDQYKTKQSFIGLVKEAIQRKQGLNRDIQSARNYWRTQQRDPMTFTDERLRLLTPTQQQSLREKRYATAGAHLQGLSEEERYRGSRLDDIIKSLEDAKQAEEDAIKNNLLNRSRYLDIISKNKSLGISPTASDFEKAGITDTSVIGSLSYRNNNPGNLKYSDWQKKYGAVKEPNSDFAKFPSEEKAKEAYKALLISPNGVYAGLTPDEAMWKWSGGGKDTQPSYTYQDLVKYGAPAVSKPFSKFTDSDWDKLFEAQKKAEGWIEPSINTGTTNKGIKVTDARKDKILKLNGMKESDLKDFGDLTHDDWTMLEQIGRETTFEVAKDEAIKLRDKGKDPEETKAILIRKFGDVLNTTEINSVLNDVGVESINNLFGKIKWKKK